MKLILKRRFKGPKYTIGSLFINGEYFCDTIEDVDRKLNDSMTEEEIKRIKVYGETAIPYGTYKIDMNTVSPKFRDRSWAKPYSGKLPRLLNVPSFEGVLIHCAEGPKGAELLQGCIGVGLNKIKGGLTDCKEYFKKLYDILYTAKQKNEKIYFFTCAPRSGIIDILR